MANQVCAAPGTMFNGVYTPIRDWNMGIGARVSEERIQQLMTFDFNDAFDLSVDDIVACNNRKSQALQWLFSIAGEKIVGEETTKKIYYEAGFMVGTKGWKGMCSRFKTDTVTPAQLAWYQDMAHFFYGPHCSAYTEYTEDTVVVTRQDCFVTCPPPGMEDQIKYVFPFVDGYLDAYRKLATYMTITYKGWITKEEMIYPVDLSKYPSFCAGKRAGQKFHQLTFVWNK